LCRAREPNDWRLCMPRRVIARGLGLRRLFYGFLTISVRSASFIRQFLELLPPRQGVGQDLFVSKF
jgi:hypothetical protein